MSDQPEQNGEGEYKPNWNGEGESSLSVKREQDNEHFDQLVDQYLKNQQHQLNIPKFKAKQKVSRWRDMRKLVLTGVFTLLGYQVWQTHQDLQRKKEARQKLYAAVKKQKSKKKGATEKHLKKLINKAAIVKRRTPAKRVAAKTAPIAIIEETPEQSEWRSLLRCASGAVWSGYHSPSFKVLADDFIVFNDENNLYVYTPQFASKDQVFSGFFWQKYLRPALSALGGESAQHVPQMALRLPYAAAVGKYSVPGHFYTDVSRDTSQVAKTRFVAGRPIKRIGKKAFVRHSREKSFWQAEQTQLNDDAIRALVGEIETQIERYEQYGKRRNFLTSPRSARNGLAQRRAVAGFCQKAGANYGSQLLMRAASAEVKRLRKAKLIGVRRVMVEQARVNGAVEPTQVLASAQHNDAETTMCAGQMRDKEDERTHFTPVLLDR